MVNQYVTGEDVRQLFFAVSCTRCGFVGTSEDVRPVAHGVVFSHGDEPSSAVMVCDGCR